jgi:hypothetical protein
MSQQPTAAPPDAEIRAALGDRPWTHTQLKAVLKRSDTIVARIIDDWKRAGLVVPVLPYHYQFQISP